MGKAVVTGFVEEKSKIAIVEAAKSIIGKGGSTTKLLEKIGDGFQEEIALLKKIHGGELPRCELRIQMIPKD